jgi:hypothetical protein
MERLFNARRLAYAQAHVRVDVGATSPEATTDTIMERIRKIENCEL